MPDKPLSKIAIPGDIITWQHHKKLKGWEVPNIAEGFYLADLGRNNLLYLFRKGDKWYTHFYHHKEPLEITPTGPSFYAEYISDSQKYLTDLRETLEDHTSFIESKLRKKLTQTK